MAIADWWENCQAQRNPFRKEKKKGQELQPPRLSDNGELELDDPSVPESTIERELGELLEEGDRPKVGLKESIRSLSNLGSVQLEKIKRIDEEIKGIRERINQKRGSKRAEGQGRAKLFESDIMVTA